ncbi:hypothetical protein [Deinococcus sp. QL22]|uniref:hypothetical protein n=1 Tax=Deinococcus sp. QL22 TaxID=2939437 RepID=UPI0020177311|nr:hypothetical protein [Deinococcus sp. QL22]UQN06445.1 hypothetical protein M1R55_00560 [Deinococcus sp. QL22]
MPSNRSPFALTAAALFSAALLMNACAPAQSSGPLPDRATFAPAPGEIFKGIDDVGDMGLWMITKDLKNATWLGEKYKGRTLREPVNVILIDKFAATPEAATARMLDSMNKAGYGPKNGHSTGYSGYLNGRLYAQYPQGDGEAFSDGNWWQSNNHGRMFGPVKTSGGYVFIGAVSGEDFRLFPNPGHPFNNFMIAREDFADKLTANTVFKKKGYIDFKGKIDTATETTADHDGCAVILVARE